MQKFDILYVYIMIRYGPSRPAPAPPGTTEDCEISIRFKIQGLCIFDQNMAFQMHPGGVAVSKCLQEVLSDLNKGSLTLTHFDIFCMFSFSYLCFCCYKLLNNHP